MLPCGKVERMELNSDLPSLPGIRDEEISASAPAVRALLVHRLEQIWNTISPHVDGTRQEDGWQPDVRFVEAGIRCLDRLAKLYRLDQPVAAAPGHADASVDQRELVSRALEEVEARMAEGGL